MAKATGLHPITGFEDCIKAAVPEQDRKALETCLVKAAGAVGPSKHGEYTEQLSVLVEKLATAKTGTMNPIVTPLPTERTVTRVNGYDATPSGILLPGAN